MIARPRRSVTRFFIPLIDVLILLFAIFLLMPFVSQPEEEERLRPSEEGQGQTPLTDRAAAEEIERLRDRMAELERDLEALRRQQPDLAENISVRVLQIDEATGDLFYFDPEREVVRTQADAQRLIDEHRRLSGLRDPFFLILYPRVISGFPTQEQIDTYRRWFAGVAHGFDNPLAAD